MSGFALRFGLRALRGEGDFWTNGYLGFARLAQNMAQGNGYSLNGQELTAFRVPFYPIFLLLTGGGQANFWTVLLAQALVSTGTIVLTALIARHLFGPATGLLAAAIAAVWPYAVSHDTALQESGLLAFLVALSIWLLLRLQLERRAMLALVAGLVLGMAILTRATILPFALCAIVWLALPLQDGEPLKRGLATAAICAGGLLLALGPWLVHAERVLGAPALGTESGRAFYAGNSELTFSFYPEQSIDRSRQAVFAAQDRGEYARALALPKLEREAWYRDRAVEEILAHPGRTVRYGMAKLWAAFGPFPSPRKSTLVNWLYALGWLPVLAGGLAGLWLDRANWRRDLLIYALLGTFAAVTAAIWGHTSHRSYLDYYFIIFAAYGIIRIAGTDRVRRALAPWARIVRRGQ
ncbi:ArnT family glycosyltransferase [Alteraurantiacibacter aestuarii]|uniref:Glycosyltransferase RgtA/B/C/D-like domain-containing protein n=1 Tax=Alteraurantiacibacter aestuarii TaxID=650004 RepID=A0A844ZKE4_9SPHN|nr:glycosyltransferase family 39 protein [Alteraurantiacibacter aestuarii]MXO88248.1 hypothetical protein [Alteraurantiacibacter aestuarii]